MTNNKLSHIDNQTKVFEKKNKDDFSRSKKQVRPKRTSIKITAIYLVLGILWILISDSILEEIITEHQLLRTIETFKGIAFVVITGIILYYLIYRKLFALKRAIDNMYMAYEELSETHAERVGVEEELRQQFDELEKHRDALEKSEQRYQLAVAGANDGIWDCDVQKNSYFFSIKWKRAFGYTEEEIGSNFEAWKSLIHPDDCESSVQKIKEYMVSGEGIYENTYRLRCKDGSYRWILSRGQAVWDDQGRAIRIAGSHTDITEQVHMQEQLRQEKELQEEIFKSAAILIITWGIDGTIINFNEHAQKVTGYTLHEAIGERWCDLLLPKENKNDLKDIYKRLMDGERLKNYEKQIYCKDGTYVDVQWDNNTLYNRDGSIVAFISIGTDITEQKEMQRRLYELAYYDSLTGLPNRVQFEKKVTRLLEKNKRTGSQFALLYIDVDNFKHVNDTLGHAAGDVLLRHMASVLKKQVESTDIIARLSGDEFAVIFTNITYRQDLDEKLVRLQEQLSQPWHLEGQEFFITVSIGIAIYPEHGEDMAELLKKADAAVFNVKDTGKGLYRYYTKEMQLKTQYYIDMDKQLRYGIKNKEFELYYQPQIDLTTGKIVGLEALIRWVHPIKGLVPPDEFIPFAEEAGYIIDIGDWVVKTACEQQKKWQQQGLDPIKISINLSGKRFTHMNFVCHLIDILEETKVQKDFIEFEVTETVIMTNLAGAFHMLEKLKELGVKLALDDFGTGYSSLNYLKQLPIDTIKIDRSFIKTIQQKKNHEAIAKAIINLAHDLQLKIVAEGIENEQQVDFLKQNLCDLGQGYLFSKPLDEENMTLLLKQKKEQNMLGF